MTIRIAINGYGRIGRNILRALYESKQHANIKIVAINSLGLPDIHAHLTRYDSAHGRFNADVRVEGNALCINQDLIPLYSERDPKKLPWADLKVDVVLECTGLFTSKALAAQHLEAGAKKVIISAPGGKDVDATVVYGVNHHILRAEHTVISNASCTTNCLAPLVKALHDTIGVVEGCMTTIHSYTNDQMLVDAYHEDKWRSRAAAHSMIPTKTGAALAVGLVLPELAGKLDGLAIRVPTINVSLVDFTFTPKRTTTVEELNQVLKNAASHPLKDILLCSEEPLVSVDFMHNEASSIVDLTQTKMIGHLAKVLAWYDNEWGFSNRMLDVTQALMQAKNSN